MRDFPCEYLPIEYMSIGSEYMALNEADGQMRRTRVRRGDGSNDADDRVPASWCAFPRIVGAKEDLRHYHDPEDSRMNLATESAVSV